jgi:hypothetical protein
MQLAPLLPTCSDARLIAAAAGDGWLRVQDYRQRDVEQ